MLNSEEVAACKFNCEYNGDVYLDIIPCMNYAMLLNKIDALISYNRSMIRILNDEKSISSKNYETAINKLAELGRIIGGLLKANPNIRKGN